MKRKEIIDGLKFTVDMFLFDPTTGEEYTEPRNDMDKTTIDACKGAIELLKQEPILDKIRAEIEKTTSRYTISRERGAMGQVEWSDRLIKESEVLEIIDKYKAESEG